MMCSIFESLAYNVRDTDDLLNPAGAAAVTGMIYKATEGPIMAGKWAAMTAPFPRRCWSALPCARRTRPSCRI